MSDTREAIRIDGAEQSGSGTIVRLSVALAALLGRRLHVVNAGARRAAPELRMERPAADGTRGRDGSGALAGALALVLLLLLAAAGGGFAGDEAMKLEITSPAFEAGGEIPMRFTCEGEDVSPPLAWSGVPAGTRSLVLIVDDPDAPDPKAPKTTWVHWVLFDLPPGSGGLAEGAAAGALPEGTRVGRNDWKRRDYGGPCPPVGRHRYFHKLYALDTELGLPAPDKAEVERAMEGHVLARAELVGTYAKHGRRSP